MGRGRHSQTRSVCQAGARRLPRFGGTASAWRRRGRVARLLCDPLEATSTRSASRPGQRGPDPELLTAARLPQHPGPTWSRAAPTERPARAPSRCITATRKTVTPRTASPKDAARPRPRFGEDCLARSCAAKAPRGPHAARRLTWSERRRQALKELAAGKPHAKVSRDAWRATERNRTRKRGEDETHPRTATSALPRVGQPLAHRSGLREVFAPSCGTTRKASPARTGDKRHARRLPTANAAGRGALGPEPVVLLIDDIPQVRPQTRLACSRGRPGPAASGRGGPGRCPGATLNPGLCGMPSSDSYAYRLLLDEWGLRLTSSSPTPAPG